MSYNTVTVTTSATLIVANNTQRQSILVTNTGTGTVYLGPDSSVTTSNGMPLVTNGTYAEDSGGTRMFLGDIYGIVASGTSDVRYWEEVR